MKCTSINVPALFHVNVFSRAFFVLLLVICGSASAQTIYYVNSATGNDANTGTSWASAFRYVPRAVAAANASSAAEVDIWVATGTYTPIDGVTSLPADHNDTSFAFYRGNGVGKALKAFGGFRGNETSVNGRDTVHPTYLDGIVGAGNSYHLIVIAGLALAADSVVVDGFTVQNGKANAYNSKVYNGISVPQNDGGGVAIVSSSSSKVAIRNCKINGNASIGKDNTCSTLIGGNCGGGGIYVQSSTLFLKKCSINSNSAMGGAGGCTGLYYTTTWGGDAFGGGIYAEASPIALDSCSFGSNSTFGGVAVPAYYSDYYSGRSSGGAIYSNNCSPVISHTTFSGNFCNIPYGDLQADAGGAIYAAYGTPSVSNCTFSSNSTGSAGGAIFNYHAPMILSNSLFNGNTANYEGGGAVFNSYSNSVISNTTFTNNNSQNGGAITNSNSIAIITSCTLSHNFAADYTGGAISNENGASANLNNCVVSYNWSHLGGGVYNGSGTSTFFHNTTFTGNLATDSGGAVYNVNCSPVFLKCTFISDTGVCGGGICNNGTAADIDSCTFSANYGTGGAIYQNGQVLAPVACSFINNNPNAPYYGSAKGGAIYVTGDATARFTSYNNIYRNNTAAIGGGAIYLNLASTNLDTLIGNLFIGNMDASYVGGGALMLSSGRHFIYNNTFFKDTSLANGGAICVTGSGGNFRIANNVFYNNQGSPGNDTSSTGSGLFVVSNNLFSTTNPLFTNPSNPAGTDGIWGTFDDGLHLTPCSPGVNTGNNAYIVTDEVSDLTGTSRILSGTVDIGAYENALVAPISGPTAVCVGGTIILIDTASAGVWSSSNTAIATVTTTGHVTGVSQGSVTISYTKSFGCASGSALYTVNVQRSAAVITGSHNVCIGSTTTLADTTTGGTWTSSNTAIATVGSGTGIVTGVAQGSCNITYTVVNSCGTSYKTFSISVFRSAAAILGNDTLCAGTTITFTDSTTAGTWSSSAPAVGTISTGGTFLGITQGATVISYSVTNVCGTSVATANVAVETPAAPITGTHNFCYTGTDTLSETTWGGTWTSSDLSIATVDTTGLVTGVGAGTCTITYEVTNHCGTTSATYALTAETIALPLSGVTSVCVGSTTLLYDYVTGGTWTSSNVAVGSVDGGGTVTGLTQGVTTISYFVTNSCGASYAPADVTVELAAQPIGGVDSLCMGTPLVFTDAANSGTWITSDPSIAFVDPLGTVTGLSPGVATISYQTINSCGSVTMSRTVTIDAMPATLTATGLTVCEGQSITVSDAVPGGTWNVDNNSLATIAGGVVSGVSAGNVVVSYTLINACGSNTATLGITVLSKAFCDSVAGTPVAPQAGEITLYPNPAASMMHIGAPVPVNVQIIGLEGKLLMELENAQDIPLGRLPNGTYIAIIYDQNGLRLKEEKFTKLSE